MNDAVIEKDDNEVKIVETDIDSKDGQNKCPKCGATEISLNANTGKLRCEFCRHEFDSKKVDGLESDISRLEGQVMTSSLQDIQADTSDILTFKCSSCGAEVVIDTAEALQARCHWCRNVLSVNQQIPNGSVPDLVLPFSVKKEEAKIEIEKFVNKRKFFANTKFKEEFTTENIMGVYFPYMLVDVNSHANFAGQGEKLIRQYTVGSGDNKKTRYDADLYNVEREFDLVINGLTIESNSEKLNNASNEKTNNVINSIMPFDVENCTKWDSNYLKGYTSERRDVNVDDIRPLVESQSKDVARFSANETLKEYNRGVAWSSQQLDIKGQQWKAAYLPVWLYSYQQVDGDKKTLHYVAVNARTKETMGSVPINKTKLLIISILIEILCFLGMVAISSEDTSGEIVLLLGGFAFYYFMNRKYRNQDARHKHETETKTQMTNIRKVDTFVQSRKGLSNPKIEGDNNLSVDGSTVSKKNDFLGKIINNNDAIKAIKNEINQKK